MCSISKVNDMLQATGVGGASPGGSPAAARAVSAVKLRHSRSSYILVDIREADEIESTPLPPDVTADAAMTTGALLHKAGDSDAFDEWKSSGKTVALVCNTGYRASIAASALISSGALPNCAVVGRGLLGLTNPAATVPDLVVILATKSDPEKITLAINGCAAAAGEGKTVVLVLMSDGVCTFLREECDKEAASDASLRVESIVAGEPFKPCKALLNKFLGSGNGVVLGCTSCVKNRGFEFGKDLLECVKPMQMPDVLRMQEETKASLQFM